MWGCNGSGRGGSEPFCRSAQRLTPVRIRRFEDVGAAGEVRGRRQPWDSLTLGREARRLSGSAPEACDLDRDKRSEKVYGWVLREVVLGEDGRRLDGRVLDRSRFQPEGPRPVPGVVEGKS